MKNKIYNIKIGFFVIFLLSVFVGHAQIIPRQAQLSSDLPQGKNCIDFEDGNSSNWYGWGLGPGSDNVQPHTTSSNLGSNSSTKYLTFMDGDNGSVAVNNKDFAGNWLQKGKDGCICFDYRVTWAASVGTDKTGPGIAIYQDIPSPTITSQTDITSFLHARPPHNSRIIAWFVSDLTTPIQNDVWSHYCLPIAMASNSTLPSNTYGHWIIRKGPNSIINLTGSAAVAAWNQLIVNVSGLVLSPEYNGQPSEIISFDNFCWTCTQDLPPEPQLCCDIKNLNVSLIPVKRIYNNNSFYLNINAGAVPIQEMEVSVLDYHMEYNTDLCKPKDLGIFGNITSPNTNFSGLVLAGNGTQDLTWELGTPAVLSGNVLIHISKPNILNLPCCNGEFYFCLKIRFKDVNCNVCEKIVCGVLNLKDQKLTQFPIPKDSLVGTTNPNNLPNTPKDSLVGDLNLPSFYPVTNPKTGKTWMDRNLGASQVATSSTDPLAYGDLYQWGRLTDGHEKRTSTTTTTLSSTDVPGNGDFIITPTLPRDWRSPQNNNLWQGVNGVNNPCPSDYRLPTIAELNAERLSWTTNDDVGAFASPLKWTLAGTRSLTTGAVVLEGIYGYYYSSNSSIYSSAIGGVSALGLVFFNTNANVQVQYFRGAGLSVRCIKN